MIQAFVLEERSLPFPALGYPVLVSSLSLGGSSASALSRSTSLPVPKKRSWKKKLLSWGSISASSTVWEDVGNDNRQVPAVGGDGSHRSGGFGDQGRKTSIPGLLGGLRARTRSMPEPAFLRMMALEAGIPSHTASPTPSDSRQASMALLTRVTAGPVETGDLSDTINPQSMNHVGASSTSVAQEQFEECDWVLGCPLGIGMSEIV